MVYINYHCQNKPANKGAFGGSLCLCKDCVKKTKEKIMGMVKGGFLDCLTDFLGNSEGQTTEEVRQELIDEGIDIDALVKKVESFIEKKTKKKGVK